LGAQRKALRASRKALRKFDEQIARLAEPSASPIGEQGEAGMNSRENNLGSIF